MKNKLLRILTTGILPSISNGNHMYGIPNNDMLSVPKNRKRHTRTVAESKKCKSCKKFNTNQCRVEYAAPLDIACYDYQPKRKK